MVLRLRSSLFVVLLTLCVAPQLSAEIAITKGRVGAVVKCDGELFAEYHVKSGHQPAVWPLIGPNNLAYTRAYPIGERGEHEEKDHRHHRSLWFSHGIVNGHDFWTEPRKPSDAQIEHRGFDKLQGGRRSGVIVTRNDWVAKGEKQCEDRRTLVFGIEPDGSRSIDFTVELIAAESPVTFGDTKEGTFAVRTAGTMKVSAKQGGRVVNNHGQVDGKAWGVPAEWVNYTGPIDGKPAGIAMFSCPSNPRHPCNWHVRGYGLFAANPFGLRHFPKGRAPQGAVTLQPGESYKLRYVVLLHDGTLEAAQLDAYQDRLVQ